MTSDSAHKRRRHRCRGRARAALVLALCICGALACGMLWVYVVFWWGNTESVRLYVTARGHVIQEHLETDAHSLLDQSLHWCHFAVQPTLFMLSSPGSVFLVFELAACERANKRADVHITFNPLLGSGVVCAGGVAPVELPTVGGPKVGSLTKGGKCERIDLEAGRSVYRVRLVGLTPGQEYSYRVDVTSTGRDSVAFPLSSSPAYRFHVSRPFRACRGKDHGHGFGDDIENFRAFIISDVQSGAAVFRRAAERISETMQQHDDVNRPKWKGVGLGCGDLLVHAGDSVQSPQIAREWHAYFLGPLEEGHIGQSLPILFARGNHDVDGWHGDDSRKHPVQIYTPGEKWQSYRTGVYSGGEHQKNGIFWIVLDSNHDSDTSQLEFLRSQLSSAACSRALFRIVIVHIAPFVEYWDPNTWARGENRWGQEVRLKFAPLFEKYGVDLVVSGHSHIYQRGDNAPTTLLREEGSPSATYVVCGGGGGELESEYFNHVEDYGFYKVTSAQYHYLEVVMRGCGLGSKERASILESNLGTRSDTLQVPVPGGGIKKLRRRRGGDSTGLCRLEVTATNPVTGANVDRFTLDARAEGRA